MYRNETGLQVLESGDEVRIGNGKVLYNVVEVLESGTPIVRSQNSNQVRQVNPDRLYLVTNIRDRFPVEEPVVETSAYAKAVLFALNKLQKHVYAGTVRKNVKAKRRALGRRQKASRKANR